VSVPEVSYLIRIGSRFEFFLDLLEGLDGVSHILHGVSGCGNDAEHDYTLWHHGVDYH